MAKRRSKKEKGITLVALIITIIVLLILARNQYYDVITETIGILTKAGQAKTLTDESQIREEIQLAWNGVQVDGVTKGWDNSTKAGALNTELLKEDGNASATWNTTNSIIDITYKGYETTINPNTGVMTALAKAGDTPITPNPPSSTVVKIGSTDISSVAGFDDSEGLKDYYGETTDFKSATTGDLATINWQLFYDDADNIYLITSDYVPLATLPSELFVAEYEASMGRRTAWFANEWDSDVGTYSGTIMTTAPWSNGASGSIFVNNSIVNNYLKWVAYATDDEYTLNNYNMRAVAYMLDTSKWSGFAGNMTGASAIGGPTVEMFALSYNAGHPTGSQLGTYSTINSDNAGEVGYNTKIGDDSWSSDADGLVGSMWVINDQEFADGYWVASPGNNNYDKLCAVDSFGSLGSSCGEFFYGYSEFGDPGNRLYGFRPIVIIPKFILK